MFERPTISVVGEKPRSPENFPDVEKALSRAGKLVFDYAIDPKDFKKSNGGEYDDESVDDDIRYTRELRSKMIDQNFNAGIHGSRARWEMLMNIGRVFEAIVLHNAGDNGWLGGNTSIIVPSEFDDIKNGIDGIVEMSAQKNFYSYLAVAMDMSTSVDLDSKIHRIIRGIDEGHLSSIRYFQSEKQRIYGQKRNVPRVVVGADKQTVHDLMVLWNGVNQPNSVMDNRGMSQHSMQIQMIDEMIMQLGAFSKYASSRGKRNLASIYDQDLDKVLAILKEKEAEFGPDRIRQMRREARQDLVFQKIREITSAI